MATADRPTAQQVAEVVRAIGYSYEAGVPPEVDDPWVRQLVDEPDGGTLRILDEWVAERHRADEATRAAYRQAADLIHAEARWQWEQAADHTVCAQVVAQRMVTMERVLRRRAEQ